MKASKRIFLVILSFAGTDSKHLFQTGDELVKIIKEYGGKGIDKIKQFDSTKDTFKKISKKDLLAFFDWQTEAYIFLQNHPFFKK